MAQDFRVRPNIIIIMTDDQGYGDLSCMGATDFRTPNLDKLAQGGVRFTDFYSASPVCSPSRASLLTGRYPGKAGVRSILSGHRKTSGLTPRVPTIATALKKLNYSTGIIGKWHLGLSPESRPNNNGFDYFYGFMAGCIDYFSHIYYWNRNTNPLHDLWENDNEIWENGEYFTDLVTRKSIEYIRDKSEGDDPFFLYVAYNAPHYPMHAPKRYMERFSHLPWDRQVMAAMLSAVDDGVGEICNELESKGLLDNTIIFFQSDNGPSRESRNWLDGNPDLYYGGSSGKLKGHKYSLFEGGIRVPAIMSWKNIIPEGQVVSEPCCSIDIFPTLLEAAGGTASDYQIDGLDIMPVLTENASSPHEMLFWEMNEQTAVRYGNYKLVLNGVLKEGDEVIDPVSLSDLSCDMAESENIADKHPDLTNSLKNAAEKWRQDIEKTWSEQFAK